jgi:hypothetical protein
MMHPMKNLRRLTLLCRIAVLSVMLQPVWAQVETVDKVTNTGMNAVYTIKTYDGRISLQIPMDIAKAYGWQNAQNSSEIETTTKKSLIGRYQLKQWGNEFALILKDPLDTEKAVLEVSQTGLAVNGENITDATLAKHHWSLNNIYDCLGQLQSALEGQKVPENAGNQSSCKFKATYKEPTTENPTPVVRRLSIELPSQTTQNTQTTQTTAKSNDMQIVEIKLLPDPRNP